MKRYRRIICLILCILTSLSTISCGEALSAFTEKDNTIEPQAEWSIYIYMVGSDLEDRGLNQLSKLTETLVSDEAKYEDEAYNKLASSRIRAFSEEVANLGVTLPNALYNKTKQEEEKTENTDLDATGYGTYSLDMLINSEIPEGVQFVVQTGGAKRWQSAYVNPNRSQRFVFDSEGFGCVYEDSVKNMADPETLEEFMVFCKENYPAKHEMIVFWDHGGAYGGYGVDDIFGTDMLTIREMSQAFANVSALYSSDGKIFDMIAFDACLMANLETVRLFRNYADYYLASAEEMSGLGWGYDRIIENMAENPKITPYELCCAVARANVENVQIDGFEGLYPATFSVIDLSKIENVYTAYGNLAKAMLRESLIDSASLAKISAEATKTLSYAYGNNGGYNLLDLGVFADNLAGMYPSETAEIKKAISESIPFLEATTYFKGGSGLSVFFPARMDGLMSLRKYLFYTNDICDNPIIDALYYYKITGGLNERLTSFVESLGFGNVNTLDYTPMSYISNSEVEVDGKGNFSLTLPEGTENLIQSVSYGLMFVDENTGDYVLFSETDKASIADGKAVSNNTLSWPAMDGSELPAVFLSEDSTQIRYRAPVSYYGLDCYMLFNYDKATGEYSIAGFSLNMDNGTGIADRTVFNFDDQDEFSIVYDCGNIYSEVDNKGYVDYVYSDKLKISDCKLSDGYYIQYIKFEDIRSDCYYSPAVVFRMENGKIVDEYVDYSLVLFDYSERR